jgi:class 3 adenylate cyclase/predicted ATPase
MQQIADWLETLGMSEYAEPFAESKIDLSVLPHLTDQDLKDIGVPLGHRRKMLAAISQLSSAPQSSPEPAGRALKQDTAERRQVTVMFSDLVGSTALASRMDPEDLREVISAYQKCVAETVQRFDGFVAKYMGDGVLVYFGYPQAHEDDAEQAVRAGLNVVQAVGGLKAASPLQTRIGIATGVVVVGDLIGAGEAQERGIVGETPNVAARLQSVAAPNTVVIAESTRRLLGSFFDLQDLGAKDLKGIGGPVRSWAVLRPASVGSRFEALHASGPIELVGREEELDTLLRRWSKAKSGEGQVVLLSGEAGIGKSRLTVALLERIATEPHTRLRYFCSPQHTDSALHPIISQMERAAGFVHDDSVQKKLDKLDAVLAQTSTSPQDAALLAEILSLPNDGRYSKLSLNPEQRRQRTLSALMGQVEALLRQNPVLMIFEYAHWADPTSLELVGRIVEKIPGLRLLLVLTYRPEFEAPWIGRSYVAAITVNRLSQREIGALIDAVVGNKPLLPSIREDIIERTDGIPLFVEEMTKAILESESEGAAKRAASAIPNSGRAVPGTLQASLLARLDRLGSAKEVAQVAAAIGREFSYALVSAVVQKPEADLVEALNRLTSTGLLLRHGIPPHASYLFKHALVQDAAYGTLLREPRRALHARIVETIETQFPEIAEGRPELLARHSTEARLIEKAAGLWGTAGQRSLHRAALIEAVEQLTRALDQIEMLPGTPVLRRQQIKLQVAIINPLGHVKGYTAPETKGAIDRARALIEQAENLGERLEDPLLLYSVLYGLWVANYAGFNGDVIRDLADQFQSIAKEKAATFPLMMGHRLMGTTLLFMGDPAQGRCYLDRALALYDIAAHRVLASRFGQDVRVAAFSYRSWSDWMLGYPDAAVADAERALADARDIDQAAELMHALALKAFNSIWCGNYGLAKKEGRELAALAEEKGSAFFRTSGTIIAGLVMAHTGEVENAVQNIKGVLSALRSIGTTGFLPVYLSYLAWCSAELDRFEDAWSCIEDALTAADRSKERWWQAETNRIAGEIVLRSPESDEEEAQTYFEKALSIAREQQTKSWELRAAMSMARLWRDRGRRQEARNLLAPLYGWFTEGFNTRDLKEAKALLDDITC